MHDPLLHHEDREAQWKTRHEEILEAVTRLLASEGPAALTMQRIAEEAGFSVGYLYKHFPGKKELLAEILDRQMAYSHEMATKATLENAGSPLRALRRRVRVLTDQMVEKRDLIPVLLSVAESYPEKMSRREKPMRQQEVELFNQAMQAGEIRVDDPVYVAAAFSGMIWGLIQHWNQTGQLEKVGTIPQLVDRLLLQPMEMHPALPGKDDLRDQNA